MFIQIFNEIIDVFEVFDFLAEIPAPEFFLSLVDELALSVLFVIKPEADEGLFFLVPEENSEVVFFVPGKISDIRFDHGKGELAEAVHLVFLPLAVVVAPIAEGVHPDTI